MDADIDSWHGTNGEASPFIPGTDIRPEDVRLQDVGTRLRQAFSIVGQRTREALVARLDVARELFIARCARDPEGELLPIARWYEFACENGVKSRTQADEIISLHPHRETILDWCDAEAQSAAVRRHAYEYPGWTTCFRKFVRPPKEKAATPRTTDEIVSADKLRTVQTELKAEREATYDLRTRVMEVETELAKATNQIESVAQYADKAARENASLRDRIAELENELQRAEPSDPQPLLDRIADLENKLKEQPAQLFASVSHDCSAFTKLLHRAIDPKAGIESDAAVQLLRTKASNYEIKSKDGAPVNVHFTQWIMEPALSPHVNPTLRMIIAEIKETNGRLRAKAYEMEMEIKELRSQLESKETRKRKPATMRTFQMHSNTIQTIVDALHRCIVTLQDYSPETPAETVANHPLPPSERYDFAAMQVGETVFLPCSRLEKSRFHTVICHVRDKTNFVLTSRYVTENGVSGLRVWRKE